MNPFDPMPTIKAILGLPIYQEVIESQLLEKLDDFAPPQCESQYHNIKTDRHSGAAGFLMQTPCGHDDGYRCVAFAKWILSHQVSHCGDCGMSGPPSDLIFLPIGGQK